MEHFETLRAGAEPEQLDGSPCPHAARCPGCALIDLAPAAQLEAKSARLAQALAGYASAACTTPAPVRPAARTLGYRTRAKLVVAAGPRLGLYARGSDHEVIDLPGCLVLAPIVAQAAVALRRLLERPPIEAGSVLRAEGDGAGCLRAVDLREVCEEGSSGRDGNGGCGVLVSLVLRGLQEPEPAELEAAAEALARELPALRGVAVSLHAGQSPQLLGTPPRAIRGADLQRDRLQAGGPFTLVAHGAFAQVHREQAAAIVAAVAGDLGTGAGLRVLEVFAGSGGFGLALAAAGAQVTMIESYAAAAAAASRAAAEQGLAGRVEVKVGYAEEWLPRLQREGARFDALLVNPPRRGVARRVREALAGLGSERLVYVSCAPETLARDLDHFAWLGLRVRHITPFDLMPQTSEVECVARLERAAPPTPVVLYEDDFLLAVDKPPGLPTVPHPESPLSLLGRVRTLPGGKNAVPVHRLDAGTSGVCLFARRAELAGEAARAFGAEDAGKRYLALVRGTARLRGRIGRPLREGGRSLEAVTRYRRLAVLAGHALMELRPETGRTHQLRRHLASIGEPVLGDERYGHAPSNRHLFERYGLDRPFLHCAAIELVHPRTRERMRFESPLAADLAAVVAALGGDASLLAGAAAS